MAGKGNTDRASREPDLLRFVTMGSVDDGKSTLIGRLLHDTESVFVDQLKSVKSASEKLKRDGVDLSLLTDGLRAEREQGITIDVAYRYFGTPRRKFIVADTPGHEQYTRNMATGASTADVAILLVDARKGILPQTVRHATIAWLLGVRKLAFAVNKMDLEGFRQEVFLRIQKESQELLATLSGATASYFPISALDGDNVVEPSKRTPWYKGPSLLDWLENVDAEPASDAPFRMAVQLVIHQLPIKLADLPWTPSISPTPDIWASRLAVPKLAPCFTAARWCIIPQSRAGSIATVSSFPPATARCFSTAGCT